MVGAPTLSVAARPGPFDLDLASAAVIVVDMQNEFAAEQGVFGLAGIDLAGIQAAVAPTARVLDAARRAGVPIVYIKQGFKPDGSDRPLALRSHPLQSQTFAAIGQEVEAPDGSMSRVMIEDTWNTDIIDELAPKEGDHVVWKRRFSAFYRTELEQLLSDLGVDQLIVTGCTTSVCVDSTIRDAMFRDLCCLLLEDCTAEPIGAEADRTNHEASLLVVEMLLGWVGTSTALLDALHGHRPRELVKYLTNS